MVDEESLKVQQSMYYTGKGGGGGMEGGGDLNMDETLTEFRESIDYCSTRRQPVVQKEN